MQRHMLGGSMLLFVSLHGPGTCNNFIVLYFVLYCNYVNCIVCHSSANNMHTKEVISLLYYQPG